MGTVKVMSIIGIVVFAVCFVGLLASLDESNPEGAAGAAILSIPYGLAYSIVVLVQSARKSASERLQEPELIPKKEEEPSTLKIMSVIGVIVFGLMFFILLLAVGLRNPEASAVSGWVAVPYGLAFSIVGLVQSARK